MRAIVNSVGAGELHSNDGISRLYSRCLYSFTTNLLWHKPCVSVVCANECLIFLSLAIRLGCRHSLLLGAFLLVRLLRSLVVQLLLLFLQLLELVLSLAID